jgi:hypothetical protein
VTRSSDVTMLAGGVMTPGRGKGGDDTSWANMNLTGMMGV